MTQGNLSSQQQVQTFGDIKISGEGNIFTVNQVIQIAASEVKTRPLIVSSPYKGLIRFEPMDKDLFFGRDQLVASLIKAASQSNLIFVLGASGSGKSSIIRAGLIPQLAELLGSKFRDFILTPDSDPFDSLRTSLIAKGYKQSEALIASQAGHRTFTEVARALKKPDAQWLFFIDQFEELFTLCQDLKKREDFIESIVQVANAQDASVKIVMAMRADFLDKFSTYPNFGTVIRNNLHLITDMHPDELRLAIEQPAMRNGVVFEQGLVEEIIRDVQGQAGSLPLLQYTLDLLWQSDDITDRTLNTKTYRELGGVRGALQKRVDDLYSHLRQDEKNEVKQIFLRLVDINGSLEEADLVGRAVSRRASLSDFSNDLEQRTLQKLVDNNLLVTNIPKGEYLTSTATGQVTVEIAHEALINSWLTLKSWIDDSKESIIIKNRLTDDTKRWKKLIEEEKVKAREELWGGTKLERILELLKERIFEQSLGQLSSDEKQFVGTSVKWRDYKLKEESERKRKEREAEERELQLIKERLEQEKKASEQERKATEQERKARKEAELKKKFAYAAAGLAFIAVGAGGFAWWRQQQAQKSEQESLRVVQDVSLGVEVEKPELLKRLPAFVKSADELRNSGDTSRALAYYRKILEEGKKIQDSIKSGSKKFQPEDNKEIQSILDSSKKSLVELILQKQMGQLREQLKNNFIGELKENAQLYENEGAYTEGALRTTYSIIMGNLGLKVDRNEDGRISQDEAELMPCEVLLAIDQEWRATTKNCGWYGANSPATNPSCQQLKGATLTEKIFSYPLDIVVNRLNQCKIPPKAMDANTP